MCSALSPRLALTLCLILALSVITAGCAPATQSPTPAAAVPTGAPAPTAVPQPTKVPAPTAAPAANPPQPPADTVSVEAKITQPPFSCGNLQPAETITVVFNAVASECYVDKQVLVIGRKDYIESKPTSLADLVPLQTLDLSAVLDGARSRNEKLEVPYFPAEILTDSKLMSVLYAISESRGTVSKVVSEINSEGKGGNAVADPNYLIGEPGIEGLPYGVVGSPFGDPATAPGAFVGQWAFKHINLAPSSSTTTAAGGIPIGIFDTFPESLSPENVIGYSLSVREGDNTKADLSLCVKSPASHAVITPVSSKTIADHGVFAAYLAQAVTHNSKISLYQVLNEYGDGNLATLNRSLLDFITSTWSSGPGVINLSLGIKRYENPDSPGQVIRWPDTCGPWNPDFESIKTQEFILHLARELGFVVVAAAGNAKVALPDLPARLPGVISVAASDADDKRACFSNEPGKQGVLAPGGNGRDTPQGACAPPFAPPFDDCVKTTDCGTYGLISLAHPKTSPTGYLYWAGTSFAAPLVSGLAAQCLYERAQSQSATQWTGTNVTSGVWNAISKGAGGSGGVINVPMTIAECKK